MTTMVTTMIKLSMTTITLLRPFESCPILDIRFPPELTIMFVSFLSRQKSKRVTNLEFIFKGSNKRKNEGAQENENTTKRAVATGRRLSSNPTFSPRIRGTRLMRRKSELD